MTIPQADQPPTLPCTPTFAHVETWVFDLDNTLYPASSRLFDQVDRRIGAFIAEAFALDPLEARALQKHYFRTYGTTLRGLMSERGVDPHVFLDYVHRIDRSGLAPAPALDAALARLAGRKLVFTNGSADHAAQVMARLGIARHFEAVFDVVAAGFLPKPDPASYRLLLERHGIAPARAAMVDDIARNLAPAAALGMTTVWLMTESEFASPGEDETHIHHRTPDLVAFLEAVVAEGTAPAAAPPPG